jgi:hypothetical protein
VGSEKIPDPSRRAGVASPADGEGKVLRDAVRGKQSFV